MHGKPLSVIFSGLFLSKIKYRVGKITQFGAFVHVWYFNLEIIGIPHNNQRYRHDKF